VVPPHQGRSDALWSLAMIVRNEEATLRNVLADAQSLCDELVVVDTGSTDATIAIATDMGASVHSFDWIDDFAAARNFAFKQCHGEWILWLDADDRVPSDAAEGFQLLKNEMAGRTDIDGVLVPYRREFSLDDPQKCIFAFDRERLLRREAGLQWVGAVHEVIALPVGRFIRWPSAWVEHRPIAESWEAKKDRNIKILERAVRSGERTPRNLFYLGNELRDHRRFQEAVDTYREYIAVSDLDWEKYSALLSMADCAAALERPEEQLEALMAAVAVDSRRAEAFNRLGVYYYLRSEWARAIPFFNAAVSCERPTEGFVSEADYRALPWDYLATCYSECGQPLKAVECTIRAFPDSTEKDRLLENLRFYLEASSGQTDPRA
jgi:glycosyltransferase involved in cell wall biosynthesis